MADITWSDVTGMFPTDQILAGLGVPAQDLILGRVNKRLSASYFGGKDDERFTLARIYLAAHMGVMGALGHGAAAGPVIAETEGGVSRSYAVMGLIAGQHSSTSYGRLFDDLVRSMPGRVGLTS